jgi:tetratricopeptide (TPR) repeat protein
LRREQIKVQAALITPLLHLKGYAAPEARAAAERARLLIEEAEALGEPPEDPLLFLGVLHNAWRGNYVAFNGDAIRDLAAQSLRYAERQKKTVMLTHAHRFVGIALTFTGEVEEGLAHLNRAHALYDRAEQLQLPTAFGADADVLTLCFRSIALWVLGKPQAALADCDHAQKSAREIGQTLSTFALGLAAWAPLQCGHYGVVQRLVDELGPLAEEKSAGHWIAYVMLMKGALYASTGKPADAVRELTAGFAKWRSMGARVMVPLYMPYLARAHADLGQFDEAWRCIEAAVAAVNETKEKLYEPNIYIVAGDIARMSPRADHVKSAAYYEQALTVACAQQSNGWELRAAIRLAQLWQDRPEVARSLLEPIYGSFDEGFETADLVAARALLSALE